MKEPSIYLSKKLIRVFFNENKNIAVIFDRICETNISNSDDSLKSNTPRNFQSTCVIETGLSSFHLMTLTTMKRPLENSSPNLSVEGPANTSQMKPLGSVY